MNTNRMCLFNGCEEPAFRDNKCRQHRLRAVCSVDGCFNQTYARQLCVKHGGKKQCSVDGCVSNARSHGVCCKHGADSVKTVCQVKGCPKYARARGRCVNHGGGRACYIESCDFLARAGGLCHHHRFLPSVCPNVVETSAVDASHDELPSVAKANEILNLHDMQVEVTLDGLEAPMNVGESIAWSNFTDPDGGAFTLEDEQILAYFISM